MKQKFKTVLRDGRKVRFKYDWDSWLAIGPKDEGFVERVLVNGKDFTCTMTTMTQQVRNAAAERGLSVSVREEGKKLYLRISQKESK